jgi:HEPN superfamily RiboL-PSP-like protein
VGIVKGLKGDLEDGYLQSFPELVRGEMFEDLNEMAKHLLQEGYKDAAAVIAGTSLEYHLSRLCKKHGVSVDSTAKDGNTKKKTAERLNQELGKTAYSLFDQKQITAWLDLRNNAAHGNYSEYDEDQVAKLIEWVGDFISKNPA